MDRSVSEKRVPSVGDGNLRTKHFHTIYSIGLVTKLNVRLEEDSQTHYTEMCAQLESGGVWMNLRFDLTLGRSGHKAPSVTLLEFLCG